MICRWCSGNGKHCGSAISKETCEHCLGYGKTANRPGGPLRNVLTVAQVNKFCDKWIESPKRVKKETFPQFQIDWIQSIAKKTANIKFDKKYLNKIINYWNNPRRDETIGEYIQRIGQLALDFKLKNET